MRTWSGGQPRRTAWSIALSRAGHQGELRSCSVALCPIAASMMLSQSLAALVRSRVAMKPGLRA